MVVSFRSECQGIRHRRADAAAGAGMVIRACQVFGRSERLERALSGGTAPECCIETTPTDRIASLRLDFMDAVRGLAVIGVVLVHTSQQADLAPGSVLAYFVEGQRGVQLFFVASAFTLMFSWNKRPQRKTEFYLRRFFRIAPLFYFALVFYGFERGASWHSQALAALFVNGLSPLHIGGANPGGWSIAVEMTFYAVFPFLAAWVTTARRAWMLFAASAALCLVVYPFAPREGSFHYFWLGNQMPAFGAGLVVYFLWKEDQAFINSRAARLLGWAAVALILALPAIPKLWDPFSVVLWSSILGALALSMGQGGLPSLRSRPVQALGTVSFGIYLFHFAVIDHLLSALPWAKSDFASSEWMILPNTLIVLAMTWPIALALHHLVELPGQRLGRRVATALLGPAGQGITQRP